MGGLFDGISIGLTGLNASQISLNTTENNIANANTPGYSRQTVNLEETFPALEIPGTRGRGVAIASITSSRNALLEKRLRSSSSLLNFYQTTSGWLNQVATLVNEPAGSGLDNSLNNFFDSFNALSTNPSSETARSNAAHSAETMAESFKQIDSHLSDMLNQSNSEISQKISKVNQLISFIAQIDGNISNAELGGIDRANSLRDKRGELLKQISDIVPVNTFETSYKSTGQSESKIQIVL